MMVGDGVTSPKTRGPWGWADGVDMVERRAVQVRRSRPRALIARRGAYAHLRKDNPCSRGARHGGQTSPRVRPREPPGASSAQHPAFPSPSLAAAVRRPPPPLPSPSFRGATGRGRRGAGRAALPRFGFLRQQPQQNSHGSARPERSRAPFPRGVGASETRQTQALNDSAIGDCAARDAPRHCRFKHACPLFGMEPMSERPLPALSQ